MPADPTMSPDRLVDTGWLADRLAVSREYAADRVTKRPDFPAPRLNLTQKTRRWSVGDIEAWIVRACRRDQVPHEDQGRK